MAVHTITFSATEESIYQKYLALIGKTEEECMATIKNNFAAQVVQTINDAGKAKFADLSVAEKLAFLNGG